MKLERILKFGLLILMLWCFICGCGGNGPAGNPQAQKTAGSLVFDMDLADIAAKTTTKVVAATTTSTTITSASVILSRSGFEPININLAVANNIATGRVDNLAEGYWYVTVNV